MKYLCGLLIALFSLNIYAQDEDRFARPDLPGELMVDIGINSWSTTPDTLDRKGWASKSIGIYYSKRYGINDKLSFYPGIGLTFEKLGFQSAVTFQDSTDYITELSVSGITKNKLAISYLEIPVEFRFHPMGTDEGEGLFVSVGGMLGLRLNAHTKWKYNDGGGNTIQKVSGRFNLENFRYGYQLRFGWRGVHLFYKNYLSNTFASPVEGVNPTLRTIGINLTGF